MSQILAHHSKSANRKKWGVCRDTLTPEGCQDVAQMLEYDAKVLADIAPDESRTRMQQARALRGLAPLTGTIKPMRVCRAHRAPRARARHTQTAQATASGSDSGGDPDPEPPRRPPTYIYSLPRAVLGGAI